MSERTELEILTDQTALVDAAAIFVAARFECERAREVVVAISRRLAPSVVTSEEAIHRSLPAAINALKAATSAVARV